MKNCNPDWGTLKLPRETVSAKKENNVPKKILQELKINELTEEKEKKVYLYLISLALWRQQMKMQQRKRTENLQDI